MFKKILSVFEIYKFAGGNYLILICKMISSSIIESALLLSMLFYINSILINKINIDKKYYTLSEYINNENIVLYLTILYLVLFIAGILIRYALLRSTNNSIESCRTNISKNLVTFFLQDDQRNWVMKSPKDLAKILCTETDLFVSGILRPILIMCVNFSVLIIILSILIVTNPLIALTSLFLVIMIMVFLNYWLRAGISTAGAIRAKANTDRFRIVNEIFDGFRTIILYKADNFAINKIQTEVNKLSTAQAQYQTLQQLTPIIFETLIMLLIIGISLFFMIGDNEDQLNKLTIQMGIFGLAAYKLKPSMQSLFNGMSTIRFNREILDRLHTYLKKHHYKTIETLNSEFNCKKFSMYIESIKIKDSSNNAVNKKIDLTFESGNIYRLKSPSGTGKTTLFDIITGLSHHGVGNIFINDELTSRNINDFDSRGIISYIQQESFIFNGSVFDNINFINDSFTYDYVKNTARIVKLENYITSNINKNIGFNEAFNALYLSGGEKQRVEIARAFLSLKRIVIMDEPFSGLDDLASSDILLYLQKIKHDKIIIITSHNEFIDAYVDKIIELV